MGKNGSGPGALVEVALEVVVVVVVVGGVPAEATDDDDAEVATSEVESEVKAEVGSSRGSPGATTPNVSPAPSQSELVNIGVWI